MNRFKEKSTWLGIASIVTGVGALAKINEAPVIADTIQAVTPAIIESNWSNVLAILVGSVAVWLREKK